MAGTNGPAKSVAKINTTQTSKKMIAGVVPLFSCAMESAVK